MEVVEIIRQQWPWYVGGVLIGLAVPALFPLGNKHPSAFPPPCGTFALPASRID